MKFDLFVISDKEREDAINSTLLQAEPSADYFLMLVLSMCMATLGLYLDEPTVIIGSMLIAPVISPVVSLALGIVFSNFKIIKDSLRTLGISVAIAVGTGVVISLFVDQIVYPINSEILARTEVNMLYFIIAFVAGLAAAFAKVKEKLSGTLPGVAISTALVPPLAVVGIGVARLDWQILSQSFLLFATNVFGIGMAAVIVFSLENLNKKRSVADKIKN